MPVENLPIWTIMPNWRNPVIERLEAMTSILESPSAAEQRLGVRWSPRRTFEPLVMPVGAVRTLFDTSIMAVGGAPWWLPLWHDRQTLTVTANAGTMSIACDTEFREFKAGGYAMLWRDEFTAEVVEVTSVDPGALTLAAGPAASWPAGTRLFPAIKARLTDMPEMGRQGSRVLDSAIRFEATEATDYGGAVEVFPDYLGLPVLTTRPDESQDITHSFARLLDEIDGETGLKRRYDTAGIGITLQRHQWLSVGRQQHAELRALFYALDGRRGLLWLPTFADDLEVVAPIDAADSQIEVRRCGFTAYGGPRANREDVMISIRGESSIFRQIVGSAPTLDGTEIIQLDAPIGVDATVRQVRQVCFMAQSRLDTDVMEISHHTDTDGASRVALPFRSAPDIRVGSEWTPAPLPDPFMNDTPCGVIECVPAIEAIGSPITLAARDTAFAAITVKPGLAGGDYVVAYANGGDIFYRVIDWANTIGSEVAAASGPPDLVARGITRRIAMTVYFDGSVHVANGGSVSTFDYSTGAPITVHTPTGYTILALEVAADTTYRLAMFDGAGGTSFATWAFGDPPTIGTPVGSGAFDRADGMFFPKLAFGAGIVTHDASGGRQRLATLDFFSPLSYGPILMSEGGASDERHVDSDVSGIDGLLYSAWRRTSGGGPGGSVVMRAFAVTLSGADPIQTVYPLTGLGISGYTHLANREPVCAVVLQNHNLVVVERRYETVGAQLRAYEALVLHSPDEPAKASNVVRLTPPATGPTGDVQRVAGINVLSQHDYSAEVIVAWENPTDNEGNTALVAQRFSVATCTPLSTPE